MIKTASDIADVVLWKLANHETEKEAANWGSKIKNWFKGFGRKAPGAADDVAAAAGKAGKGGPGHTAAETAAADALEAQMKGPAPGAVTPPAASPIQKAPPGAGAPSPADVIPDVHAMPPQSVVPGADDVADAVEGWGSKALPYVGGAAALGAGAYGYHRYSQGKKEQALAQEQAMAQGYYPEEAYYPKQASWVKEAISARLAQKAMYGRVARANAGKAQSAAEGFEQAKRLAKQYPRTTAKVQSAGSSQLTSDDWSDIIENAKKPQKPIPRPPRPQKPQPKPTSKAKAKAEDPNSPTMKKLHLQAAGLIDDPKQISPGLGTALAVGGAAAAGGLAYAMRGKKKQKKEAGLLSESRLSK